MRAITFLHAFSILGLATYVAQAQITFTTVGVTRQPAPGAGAAADFFKFNHAALNGAGQVAFSATLFGPGIGPENDTGIWAGSPRALFLAVREWNPAPGTTNAVVFSSFGPPLLNSAGHIAFSARLTGRGVTSENDAGIWAGSTNRLALVARSGSRPPGTPAGVRFASLGRPAFHSSDQVAFAATLFGLGVGSENDSGIWAGSARELALLVREWDVAPGVPTGAKFSSFSAPALNDPAQAAFRGMLAGRGIIGENDTGIWAGATNALRLVAREGNAAPGIATGARFDFFELPLINSAAKIAFRASLTGLGVIGENDTGIWAGSLAALELVAREGEAAPGIASGARFNSFDSLALGGRSEVAFRATLTGLGVTPDNDAGIWAGRANALRLVARTGDAAPGTTNGTRFASFSDPVFTAAGTVAFLATLDGRGVASDSDTGIWAVGPGGTLQLVVREGSSLTLAEDDTRRIRDGGLLLFSNQGGDETNSSAVVQLLFQAGFIDRESALSIATLRAPAPRIIAVRRLAGRVEISFETASSLKYAVEYSTSATPNSWRTLVSTVRGTGRTVTVADAIQPGQPARLYRVKVF